MRTIIFALIIVFVVPVVSDACPCDGMTHKLSLHYKVALSSELAKQLEMPSVAILESFYVKGWSIFLVDTHQADEVFLFFSQDPLKSHYVTLWAGAARSNEEVNIKKWVIKNAPGIPSQLAECFAWHVTNDPVFRNDR